jgi:hypothetical protein
MIRDRARQVLDDVLADCRDRPETRPLFVAKLALGQGVRAGGARTPGVPGWAVAQPAWGVTLLKMSPSFVQRNPGALGTVAQLQPSTTRDWSEPASCVAQSVATSMTSVQPGMPAAVLSA